MKKYYFVRDNPIFTNGSSEETQKKILFNYWKAIANIIGSDGTVLYRYIGVLLFTMFSISFFHEIEKTSNNYYVSVMQEHLQRCFEGAEGEATGIGHAEFWKSGGIASGLNGGAIARVCQRLIKALRPPSDFIGDI